MSNLAGTFKSTLNTVTHATVTIGNEVQVRFDDVVTGAEQNSYLLQCDIANTSDTGVQVSVKITRGLTSAYLVKKAPVPQGSTLQIIDGQKLVLQENDVLQVACETEGQTVDVIVSHVDHVNLEE
jgi:hypothetical protein